MNEFLNTHPRTKLIYRTLAFATSILLWVASIFSLMTTSYIFILGTGGNIALTMGLGIVSLLPLGGLMTMFAYHGIKKRGDKMVNAFKEEWHFARELRKNGIKKRDVQTVNALKEELRKKNKLK